LDRVRKTRLLLAPSEKRNEKWEKETMTSRLISVGRRKLVCGIIAGMAGLVRGTTASANGREKMSKQQAEYQDSPRDIRMCATCPLFEPPKSCKVVEGDVSPGGWCKAFAFAD
jgi:hypothetical protein